MPRTAPFFPPPHPSPLPREREGPLFIPPPQPTCHSEEAPRRRISPPATPSLPFSPCRHSGENRNPESPDLATDADASNHYLNPHSAVIQRSPNAVSNLLFPLYGESLKPTLTRYGNGSIPSIPFHRSTSGWYIPQCNNPPTPQKTSPTSSGSRPSTKTRGNGLSSTPPRSSAI